MEAFQNKNDQPTTVDVVPEQIAEDKLTSSFDLKELQAADELARERSGFTRRLAAGLDSNGPLGTVGRSYLEQELILDETTRTGRRIYVVYKPMDLDDTAEQRLLVGQQSGHEMMTGEAFTMDDLMLAKSQLDTLRTVAKKRHLMLNKSLGAVANFSAASEHGF
jgi:hypothetical protein